MHPIKTAFPPASPVKDWADSYSHNTAAPPPHFLYTDAHTAHRPHAPSAPPTVSHFRIIIESPSVSAPLSQCPIHRTLPSHFNSFYHESENSTISRIPATAPKTRYLYREKTARASLRLCAVLFHPIYPVYVISSASGAPSIPLLPPARLLPSRMHT